MQRITEIRLRNYRAFGDREEVVSLPKRENLLIYGENGSGKSTVYAALRDLLESSVNPGLDYTPNVYLPNDAPGHVAATFREVEPYISNSDFVFGPDLSTQRTAQTAQFLKGANKSRAFLGYKEIVRTYLSAPDEASKLFQVLIEVLLEHHVLDTNDTLGGLWEQIKRDLRMHGNSSEYRNAEERLAPRPVGSTPNFKVQVDNLLKAVFLKLNTLLETYFSHGVELGYVFDIKREAKEVWGELQLVAKFNGKVIDRHFSDFLNEARLSALSICFYLAAIQSNPQPNQFKLVFLDDVFIGLDTSNRLPLLKLLHEQFALQDYQIILTTYDRVWFELARLWFQDQLSPYGWQHLEMYEEQVQRAPGETGPEHTVRPVLVPSEGNLARATGYFRAKDYPAAGNYLRKALEEGLQLYLPKAFIVTSESADSKQNLEGLLNSFDKFHEILAEPLPPKFAAGASVLKRLVFNPASHFDPGSPLYRIELEQGFELLDELAKLPKLRRQVVYECGTSLTYKFDNPVSGIQYELGIILTADLYCADKTGAAPRWFPCRMKATSFKLNGVVQTPPRGEFTFEKIIEQIIGFLNTNGETVTIDWERNFVDSKGKCVADRIAN